MVSPSAIGEAWTRTQSSIAADYGSGMHGCPAQTRDTRPLVIAGGASTDYVRTSRAWNRTRSRSSADDLAPDFEVRQASSHHRHRGHLPWAGRDSRRDAVTSESFEDLSFEPEKFFEAPGGEIVVFIHVRGRGRGSGVEMDNHIAWVWTYRDDKAVRLVIYEEPSRGPRSRRPRGIATARVAARNRLVISPSLSC